MTQKAPELLPCPFCGGEASREDGKYDFGGDYYDTGCGNVGCPVLPSVRCLSREDADKAWNTRTDHALALVAAAYEDAADTCYNPKWPLKTSTDHVQARTAGIIRARTPDDATAALERVKRDARNEALRELAAWAKSEGMLFTCGKVLALITEGET